MSHFMTTALPTGTTLDLVRPEQPALPAGLTELDAAQIPRAIAAAKSETTRGVYAQVWGHWERWCARRGTAALPADPPAVSAYLTERAEGGEAISTLDMSCTVIPDVHRMTGVEDPVASEAVRQVRRG
jgi:predicted GNAT family acetyltransferase